jgi:signal transduction histidine kinase
MSAPLNADCPRSAAAAPSRHDAQLCHAERLEAIALMAGGIAHDFNNLLLVISASAEFLKGSTPADDPRQEDIQHIRQAAMNAAELTRQLLAFSRQQALQPSTFALNDAMRRLQPLLEGIVGETVQCVVDLGPEVGDIHADAGQIEQVVLNLVMNARDAMPAGGVLTLRTRCVRHRSRDGTRDGDWMHIVVSDTGTGMSKEVLARAFDPFFTTKDKEQGTGLGLATVYGIVQQSGGEIAMQSTPGLGTRVEVWFPDADMAVPGGPR